MTILVLNSGSSSLKCQLFSFDGLAEPTMLAKAAVERIGTDRGVLTFQASGAAEQRAELPVRDHLTGIRWVLEQVTSGIGSPLDDRAEIDAIGHRVVHGGTDFTGSVLCTDAVIQALEDWAHLAPLHNPPNMAGIKACRSALPGKAQVCVFDTALHQDLPPEAWHYALPARWGKAARVRRYGFHGIAFRSMSEQVATCLNRPLSELRLVNMMLGSGTTANALRYGHSVAVSTGFTPLEGLIQSTRCGDLDPGVTAYLLRSGLSPSQVGEVYNRQSGLLGISGLSNDMRDLRASSEPAAALAIEKLIYSVARYAGAYAADMGGLDVLAFSGGIAQNNPFLRTEVCAHLRHIGVILDEARNQEAPTRSTSVISADGAAVQVVLTAANEELVIARDTLAVLQGAA